MLLMPTERKVLLSFLSQVCKANPAVTEDLHAFNHFFYHHCDHFPLFALWYCMFLFTQRVHALEACTEAHFRNCEKDRLISDLRVAVQVL